MTGWLAQYWRRLLIGGVAALLLVALWAVGSFGAVGLVYLCPYCYGFERIGRNVFIEAPSSADEQARLLANLDAADARLDRFLTLRQKPHPVVIACATPACFDDRGGGGAIGHAYGSSFMLLSPSGWDAATIAHEWAHLEFFELMPEGVLSIPAWFVEGVAVVASRDAYWLRVNGAGDLSCSVPAWDDLPEDHYEWWDEMAAGTRPIYASAGCRALKWLNRHGGAPALTTLARRLDMGGAFYE